MRSFLFVALALSALLLLVQAQWEGPSMRRGARELPSLGGVGGGGFAGRPEFTAVRDQQRRFYNPYTNQLTAQNHYNSEGPINYNHLLALNTKYLHRLL